MLMRLVLGVAEPSDGRITLFNSQPLRYARHHIGALLEYPCLYKNCTAYENLKRFSLLTDSNNKQINNILKLVGLDKVGNKKSPASNDAGDFCLLEANRLRFPLSCTHCR